MKIVIILNFAPSLVNFRGPLIRSLVADGHTVIGLAPDVSEEIRAEVAEMGASVETIPMGRTSVNPAVDLRTLASVARRLRRHRPDLVLTFTHKANIYGGLAAQITRVPHRWAMVTGLGYSFLGQDSTRRRVFGRFVRLLLRAGFSGADGVFFQNPDDLALFEKHRMLPRRARRVLVNGSGLDVDHYAQVPWPAQATTFLFVGRLLREKGILDFVAAARQVRAKHPEARFVVLGWVDPNPASVSAPEVAAWEREGVIDYAGETNDVRPYLAACHALVLPSYREGTPRSVLEAMATGRAIITTDVPGCRETVVDGDNGFLVPVRDPDALAAAMLEVVENPERAQKMGARSREIAEQKYDVHKVNAVMFRALGL